MAFSDEEIAYLQSQPVARLATVNGITGFKIVKTTPEERAAV